MRRLRGFALLAALLLAVVCPASAQAVAPPWRDASLPGNGVVIPRLLKEVKPRYTIEAMTAKIQGTVLVECVVEVDGMVRRARVVRSLDPMFGLDQSALDAVKEWQFEPGTRDGTPVPVVVTIELSFVLRADPADKAPLTLPQAFGVAGSGGVDDVGWEDDAIRSSPLTVGLHHPKGWRVTSGVSGLAFVAQPTDAALGVLMIAPVPTTVTLTEPGTTKELQEAGAVVASGFKRQLSAVGQARIAERVWVWFDLGIADAPELASAGLGATRLWVFSASVEGHQVILAFTIGHPKGTSLKDSDAEALRIGPTFRNLLERISFQRTP